MPLPGAPTPQSIISEENYCSGWPIVRGQLNNQAVANWFQKQPCTSRSQETGSELPGWFSYAPLTHHFWLQEIPVLPGVGTSALSCVWTALHIECSKLSNSQAPL